MCRCLHAATAALPSLQTRNDTRPCWCNRSHRPAVYYTILYLLLTIIGGGPTPAYYLDSEAIMHVWQSPLRCPLAPGARRISRLVCPWANSLPRCRFAPVALARPVLAAAASLLPSLVLCEPRHFSDARQSGCVCAPSKKGGRGRVPVKNGEMKILKNATTQTTPANRHERLYRSAPPDTGTVGRALRVKPPQCCGRGQGGEGGSDCRKGCSD